MQQQARALDLAGRVRNAADGSVIVDVSGTADAVAKLEAVMAVGPRGAVVDRVTVLLDGAAASREVGEFPLPFVIDR